MAYDGTIPSLSNQIGNDIPQIQENFSLLESAQVVDEGSTEDGDYIRYENGWQMCWKREAEITYEATNRLESPHSYPADFDEEPYNSVVLSTGNSLDGQATNNSYSRGELQISALYLRTSSTSNWNNVRIENNVDSPFESGDTGLVDIFAIGRWK